MNHAYTSTSVRKDPVPKPIVRLCEDELLWHRLASRPRVNIRRTCAFIPKHHMIIQQHRYTTRDINISCSDVNRDELYLDIKYASVYEKSITPWKME